MTGIQRRATSRFQIGLAILFAIMMFVLLRQGLDAFNSMAEGFDISDNPDVQIVENP